MMNIATGSFIQIPRLGLLCKRLYYRILYWDSSLYLGNLMRIAEYLPNDRQSLITLVIDRLVQLDANLPFGEDLYDEGT